jgi:hypothetical protein
MIRHIYSIGQSVSLAAKSGIHVNPTGIYTVTRLLPPIGVEFQYRIRSMREAHERVVVEHQINAAEPTKTSAEAEIVLTRASEIARVFAVQA